MKKILLAVLIAVCSLAIFTACNGQGGEQSSPTEESYTVEISQTTLTLDVYETVKLTATVKNGNGQSVDKEVEWSSNKAAVATVDDGLVMAKSMGTATVTAQVKGETASATVSVTVTLNGYVPSLSLSETDSLNLAVGTTFDLAPKVLFKGVDATDADTSFIYEVSDKAVASVENGVITALATGTATITVTASWRGLGGATMAGSEDALGLRITLNLTVKAVD